MLLYQTNKKPFQFYRKAVVHGLCELEPDPGRESDRDPERERARDGGCGCAPECDCERAPEGERVRECDCVRCELLGASAIRNLCNSYTSSPGPF